MTHATDDELLEIALTAGEPDPASHPHLPGCPDCAARLKAVQDEQDLLRGALSAPPTAVAPPRRSFPRTAVAAVFVAGVAVGAFLPLRPSRPPAAAADDELRGVPAAIARLRTAPDGLEAEYPRLISRASTLYADYLAGQLARAAPLSGEQRERVRGEVEALCDRLWRERDLGKLARDYRAALEGVLNERQYRAFTEHLVQEMESDWVREVDIVADHVARALDLRMSEVGPLRDALRAQYPKTEVPLLSLAQWPPDLLAADRALAETVRASLPADRRDAFGAYVAALEDGRKRAERVVREATGQ